MLRKINSLLRIAIVLLLIYPMPIGVAQEVTVNEGFADLIYEAGLIVTSSSSSPSIYSSSNEYGTTGNALYLSNGTYTFTFSSDINVYEVGFNVGAVNNAYSVKYYYSDGTDETLSMSAQDSSNPSTMYDNFYKTLWDYNNNEANTDKYINGFDVVISDASLFDTLYWQYDDGLTAGVGAPTNLTVSANLHNGSITVDWDAPANTYQYSPERYAIGFDKADPPMYGIATGNVGDENALNTEYTFTKSYLQSALDAQVGDTLYFKIRSDNDTNSSYSSWTTIASYTIENAPSGVTDVLITNNEYQGLKIGWVQPNTGWGTVSSYYISYKLSSEETYTYIQNIDVNATSYLIEDIQGGTYDFVVYACSSTGWCHGGQAGPIFNFEVLSTTAVTTTTTTLPPPPPPPPPSTTTTTLVEIVMEDGSTSSYTEDQINQGDVERDNERKANEEKWGCYVTNIALERGDCEAYNTALYNSTTTTTLPEIKEEIVEEVIVVEEVKDEEIIEDKPENDIIDDTVVEDIKTEEIKDEEIIDPEILEDEVVVVDTTLPKEVDEEKSEPIKEDYPDETDVVVEQVETDEYLGEEGDSEVQLTDEEIEVLVAETEDLVKDIVIIEDEVITEDMTEEEIAQADQEFEEKVEKAVKELPKEKKVEIVKEVAKVSVQNLANTDQKTQQVVQAVVTNITKKENVAELNDEEKEVVGKLLGVQKDDVDIIAEQATKEKNIETAVNQFVERSVKESDTENYTLADVVTEIQVEAFIEDPIGQLTDINLSEIDLSTIGQDMTSDQRKKATEVVIPVIVVSQIIISSTTTITNTFRRF